MGIFSSFLSLLGCHVFRVFKSCLNTYREVLISFSPDPFRSSLVHLYSSDTFPIIPSSSQFLRYRNSYFQFEFKMMCKQYIESFADLTRWTFCFANIQLGSFFIVSERVRNASASESLRTTTRSFTKGMLEYKYSWPLKTSHKAQVIPSDLSHFKAKMYPISSRLCSPNVRNGCFLCFTWS